MISANLYRLIVTQTFLVLATNTSLAQDRIPNFDREDWKKAIADRKLGWSIICCGSSDEAFPKGASVMSYCSSILEDRTEYDQSKLTDQNNKTAWCEGVAGAGIGEVVAARNFNLIDKNPLWIWAGFGKSPELYKANNRPRRVKVYVFSSFCWDTTPGTKVIWDYKLAGSHEVELQDKNGMQKLELPDFKADTASCSNGMPRKDSPEYLLALEFVSVYKGEKYDDTCITEVASDVAVDNKNTRKK